ncbi:CRISPR-associated protein Cas1 [Chloroherpeton thalassium ATCC 35110]|uniref:CRISPR-associated endonuclease Cas1 n=1 Tax=Chloroherpeton thalassium (strain ATCC 35110 / GB-78) TaxID=517418 RepID=B3QWN8_CHLT3|nr:type I-B CRISPR-associated endonuclease Cas1b [Chloroherpeton thalassium]ACF14798.1 CRISPR-associated protein Cas1 [Chloroherpeton thalassium ATCC 35110]
MSTTTPSKQAYYIFSNGILQRKDNTIRFVPTINQEESTVETDPDAWFSDASDESFDLSAESYPEGDNAKRKVVPINSIDAFYVFGETSFNTKFFNFLAKEKIPLHLFNYYGYYSGTFYPRDYLISGYVIVQQVKHYTAAKKRIELAREFISAAALNILKNLKYYIADSRKQSLKPENIEPLQKIIEKISDYADTLIAAGDIPTLMGLEGNIRQMYYEAWPLLLKTQSEFFAFEKRVRNPPDNAINALISFGNSLMYSACLTEIYRTQLHPAISFLHEPSERRFSLALDLAEIFKPIFVDRIIFKLINTQALQAKHFAQAMNFCHLNNAGQKIFVSEFEDKLRTTIKHRSLDRQVSFRRLIRLECYRLIKHLLGEKNYEGFKIWW